MAATFNAFKIDLLANRLLRRGEEIKKTDICRRGSDREPQPVPDWWAGGSYDAPGLRTDLPPPQ